MSRRTALAVLVLAAGLGQAADVSASWPGTNGEIDFDAPVSQSSNDPPPAPQLFAVRPDGSGLRADA